LLSFPEEFEESKGHEECRASQEQQLIELGTAETKRIEPSREELVSLKLEWLLDVSFALQ